MLLNFRGSINGFSSLILASKARLCLFRKFKPFSSYFWIDGVQVENIGEKAKNTCRCSKIPLHKNFKLVWDQNVTNQTYLKLSCRSQKCSVQSLNEEFYFVKLNFVIADLVIRSFFQAIWKVQSFYFKCLLGQVLTPFFLVFPLHHHLHSFW